MPLASHPILDELRAGHVITSTQHQAAIAKLVEQDRDSEPFQNLGAAIQWLAYAEVLTDDEILDLAERAEDQAGFATNATLERAMAEHDAFLNALGEVIHREAKQAFWAALMPGPRWAYLVGAPCLLLLVLWGLGRPAEMPDCDDARVESTITSAMSQALRQGNTLAEDDAGRKVDLSRVRLTGIKEVGYIEDERSRGCSATMRRGDLQVPVAYVVRPDLDPSKFRVTGVDPRVMEATYGHIRDGKRTEGGQPIGAATLRAVFTQAVADFKERSGRGSARDTDAVRSVLALGPCTPADSGRYSCRLQVQYRDLAMSLVLGAGLQVLEGDFEFEQQAGRWQVAPGFDHKFTEAQDRARVATLRGDPKTSPAQRID